MLIRSQDRETLINLDNSIVIDVMDIEGTIKVVCSYSCEDYVIGHYSTRGKVVWMNYIAESQMTIFDYLELLPEEK